MIESKAFFHDGYWVRFYVNKHHIVNLFRQTRSEILNKTAIFLDQIIDGTVVPYDLFTSKDTKRVTGILEKNLARFDNFKSIREKENDLLPFINAGLRKLSEKEPTSKSRHRYVLTEILEKEPTSIASEVPVFDEVMQVTGHIDLLRYNPKIDKLEVLDYKPEGDVVENVQTQILLYRELLCKLILNLKLEDIVVKWFTNREIFQVKVGDQISTKLEW